MFVKLSAARILAAINVAVGLVLSAGGFLEASVSIRRGSGVTVALGALGGVAGLLFLVSAVALWRLRGSARADTLAAAGLALAVHGAGVMVAHPGLPAILVGVVYPAAVLLLLWTTPGVGTGQSIEVGPREADRLSPPDASLRTAMA